MPHRQPHQPGVVARLIDWLNGDRDEAPDDGLTHAEPVAAEPAKPSATRAQAALAERLAVQQLIAKLREAKIDATAGMIQIVELGEARAAIGTRWPEMAETVMKIAANVLKVRLDPNDLFTQVSDKGFVVIFTRLNPEEARWRAEAIGREICLLLRSLPGMSEAIAVEHATQRVSEMATGDAELALDKITDHLEARCEMIDPDAEPVSKRAAPAAPAATLRPAIAPTGIPPNPAATAGTARPARSCGILKTETTPELPELEALPAAKQRAHEQVLKPVYRPVLTVPSQTIELNFAVPRRYADDGNVLIGQWAYFKDPQQNLNQDLLLCNHVLKDLRIASNDGRPVKLCATAHIDSLDATEAFTVLFSQLTDQERRLFTLEILNPDPATPASRLVNIVSRYRSFTSSILLRVGITDSNVARYTATGISSTGCHIRTAAPYSHSQRGCAELMRGFSANVRRSGLACHFHGVHDRESMVTALSCGARYISGEFIGPFTEHPSPKRQIGTNLSSFLSS